MVALVVVMLLGVVFMSFGLGDAIKRIRKAN